MRPVSPLSDPPSHTAGLVVLHRHEARDLSPMRSVKIRGLDLPWTKGWGSPSLHAESGRAYLPVPVSYQAAVAAAAGGRPGHALQSIHSGYVHPRPEILLAEADKVARTMRERRRGRC